MEFEGESEIVVGTMLLCDVYLLVGEGAKECRGFSRGRDGE